MTLKYGSTEGESHFEEMIAARQIVQQIVSHGVSQKTIIKLIHLLSLELEDRDLMMSVVELTKQAVSGPVPGVLEEAEAEADASHPFPLQTIAEKSAFSVKKKIIV